MVACFPVVEVIFIKSFLTTNIRDDDDKKVKKEKKGALMPLLINEVLGDGQDCEWWLLDSGAEVQALIARSMRLILV